MFFLIQNMFLCFAVRPIDPCFLASSDDRALKHVTFEPSIQKSTRMFAALFAASVFSETPAEVCGKFSDSDCSGCLEGRGKWSCGWCLDGRLCLPGTVNGSLNPGPCFSDSTANGVVADWLYDKTDERCIDDSSKALPMPVRIGLGVGVLIIFLIASSFWCFIYPKYFMPQAPQEKDLPINTDV
jgi:hypothetical protein